VAEVPERTIVFVPSLGLGYGLDALVQRCPPSSHILCIEADQALMALAVGFTLPKDPRLSIYRTHDPLVVATLARALGIERFRRCRLVNLCGGYHLARSLYDEMFRVLERLLAEHWQNRMTAIHLGSLWVKNCLENVALVPRSLPLAALRSPGAVVVAGAGPSLEESLDQLWALRPHVRLLAVDTALPVLAAHGVRPDLVFILEAQHANLYDFLPLPDPTIDVVADLTAHPGCLRLFRARRALVLTGFRDLSLFRRMEEHGLRPPDLRPLGSVGVAACALALELTPDEVLTVGLDFAYRGDKTHAAGSPFHTYGLCRGTRTEPATTVFHRATHRHPLRRRGMWASDAVLDSYAQTLRALAAGAGRIYRLRADGTRESWGGTPPHGPSPATTTERTGARTDDPLRFYTGELELIEAALRATAAPGAAGSTKALRAVDYAFVHFPESAGGGGTQEAPTAAYLARARQALLVYRARIRRLADRTGTEVRT
jgi:hypothetical protein